MTIALIAFVLLLGIILIFLEIFVIPGTTFLVLWEPHVLLQLFSLRIKC